LFSPVSEKIKVKEKLHTAVEQAILIPKCFIKGKKTELGVIHKEGGNEILRIRRVSEDKSPTFKRNT